MNGLEFVGTLPEKPGPEREAMILQAVKDGHANIEWHKLKVTIGDNELVLAVSSNTLRIGEDDPVRVAVTCRTQQLIADELDCLLPTATISDLCYLDADHNLAPCLQSPDAQMAYTSRFVEESDCIDRQQGAFGLAAPEGKDWVLCKALWQNPQRAANYGWQTGSGPYPGVTTGIKVLQPLATAHNLEHTDYSQLCRLVRRECQLNGCQADLGEIYTDPNLAGLISHEGALPGDRHPGVAPDSATVEAPVVAEPPSFEYLVADPTKQPTIRRGSRLRGAVKTWQEALITARYSLSPYGADGDFGRLTDIRTRAYQRDRNLVVDGVVGPKTWGTLATARSVRVTMLPPPPGGPPLPDFLPLYDDAHRAELFGKFSYRASPQAGNPEAIIITDDWVRQNIVQVELPLQGVLGAPRSMKVSFHRLGAPQLEALWQAWKSEGLLHHVLSWAGSWSPRFIRGSTSRLSNHAFGSAFDINAPQNWLGAHPADYGVEGSARPLVPLAHQYGFYWGGHFTRTDGMHFEIAQLL